MIGPMPGKKPAKPNKPAKPARRRPAGLVPRGGPTKDARGWTKQEFELPADHGWKAAPGYLILVLDAGDLRVEYPQGWVNTHDQPNTICLHDVAPPADECRISVSRFRSPPGGRSFAELPVREMLIYATEHRPEDREEDPPGEPEYGEPGQIISGRRLDLEWAWRETPWTDTEQHPGRQGKVRRIFAKTPRIAAFISFDWYVDRSEEFVPVFEHLLRSLKLARPVTPTMREGMN